MPRGSFYRPRNLLEGGACRGLKWSGGRRSEVAGATIPWRPLGINHARHPCDTAIAPNGPDELRKSVSSKIRVGILLCHMLEDHNPCDIIFLPLDQTDLTLDASDGLLEVSCRSVTWFAMLGVAPAM